MKFYLVKPFDTVVFGENKSSVAGEDHEKGSKFPPEIMKLFNLGEKVAFYGIFPVMDNRILLPMPADVLGKRKEKKGPFYIPFVNGIDRSKVQFETDMGIVSLPWVKEFEALEKLGGYITSGAFIQKYKKKSAGRVDLCKDERVKKGFLHEEIRIGIAIDYSLGTVEESKLYAHVHLRLKDGFVVLISGDIINKKESNVVISPIGGERKMAKILSLDGLDESTGKLKEEIRGVREEIEKNIKIRKGETYKFYLMTHAFVSCELKVCREIVVGSAGESNGVKMGLKWVYSNGVEWISGIKAISNYVGRREKDLLKKPAVLMLKPGTVFVFEALEDGVLKGLSQIKDPLNFETASQEIEKDRFLERGWGSGIIWKISDEN